MKRTFVKTQNAMRFLGAIDALNRRGAAEACIVVVDGEPGLGKSATINWWAVQQGAIFLRAKREWTPNWALKELLEQISVRPEYSFERMFRQALEHLGTRMAAADREDRTYAIVIDEVDHICRNSRLLETLRDISDMLEIPLILVGMGRVRHALGRFPQVASRVAQYVDFTPAPEKDVETLVEALSEVPVAEDLVSYLHRESKGKFREVKEGIASIERFGRRLGGEPVTLQAMAGQVLLNDRATSKPIKVRA